MKNEVRKTKDGYKTVINQQNAARMGELIEDLATDQEISMSDYLYCLCCLCVANALEAGVPETQIIEKIKYMYLKMQEELE